MIRTGTNNAAGMAVLFMLAACGGGADQAPAAPGSDAAVLDTTPPGVTYEPKATEPGMDGAEGVEGMEGMEGKAAGEGRMTIKPQSPIRIGYRIIGEPIVGQPVAIDLRFESAPGARSFEVEYRINDTTALQFPEGQAERVTIAPSAGEGFAAQQVRVIPLREGRLFLNVAAEMTTDAGTMASVTAVPIDVGKAEVGKAPATASPGAAEAGVITTDEAGEPIRTLPGRTD